MTPSGSRSGFFGLALAPARPRLAAAACSGSPARSPAAPPAPAPEAPPTAAAPAPSPTPAAAPSPDPAFEAFAQQALDGYLRHAPDDATIQGEHRYDATWPDVSVAGRGALPQVPRRHPRRARAAPARQAVRAEPDRRRDPRRPAALRTVRARRAQDPRRQPGGLHRHDRRWPRPAGHPRVRHARVADDQPRRPARRHPGDRRRRQAAAPPPRADLHRDGDPAEQGADRPGRDRAAGEVRRGPGAEGQAHRRGRPRRRRAPRAADLPREGPAGPVRRLVPPRPRAVRQEARVRARR